MPKSFEEYDNLLISEEEIGRQAVSSLRGYIYQIYQSILAWITLQEEETLLLEVAEDFAVLSKSALKGTQVKDTASSSSVTLKSKSITDTIKSLWRFQHGNPDKSVSIIYLTTSTIGKEKELPFPDNQRGLVYWRVAARENADVEPLRKALLTLKLPKDIKEFIKTATKEKLQDKLIRRIKWICGAEDITTLQQTILDKLVYFGEKLKFTPSDSEKARDSLVTKVLEVIVQKNCRKLSKADFLRSFEKSVSITVPVGAIRELLGSLREPMGRSTSALVSTTKLFTNAARIPFPRLIIDRHELVSRLISEMARSGTLWLHGSSGLGKTILAQFIVRKSKHDWYLMPLRGCSGDELEFRLHTITEALNVTSIGGVILDDFPTKHAHIAKLRLSMLVSEIHRLDGGLIVTSSKPPSSILQNCFGQSDPHVIDIPYLSQEEVAELVSLTGGDANKWAGIIRAFCGFGHPQLTHARIDRLRRRGWPDSELLTGVEALSGPTKEVEFERNAVRDRLIQELSKTSREFLYRLTLIGGNFDRNLAISTGEIDPTIQYPGEAMDELLGGWVEVQADNQYRVSPLVSDAGIENLNKKTQLNIHKQIVDHLMCRQPFPAHFLGTLLAHAISSRHTQALSWLSYAVVFARDENIKIISERLFLLTVIGISDDKPLFPENRLISVMLRLAQFQVAVETNKTELLDRIANRFIAEARKIDDDVLSKVFTYIAICKILLEPKIQFSPKEWMPLIEELEEIVSSKSEIPQIPEFIDVNKTLEGWSLPEMMFAYRATAFGSIRNLVELFSELDQQDNVRRDFLLSSLRKPHTDISLMVQSTWLNESKKGVIDGFWAAKQFENLTATAEKWKNIELAIECRSARVIMLDEYANDKNAALVALGEADQKYPNNIQLARRRAMIHYRKGEYPLALGIFERITEEITKADTVETAFVFRDAGIAAAKIGKLKRGCEFFLSAYESACKWVAAISPMAVGLLGDSAVLEFVIGNHGEALRLMHKSLIGAEKLNPDKGINEKYCRIALEYTISWMNLQVEKSFPSSMKATIRIGCCSDPEPAKEILKKETPSILSCWYMLSILESKLKITEGVLEELRSRSGHKKILKFEISLSFNLMSKPIYMTDVKAFFSHLPDYILNASYSCTHIKELQEDNVSTITTIDPRNLGEIDWNNDVNINIAKDAILSFQIISIFEKNLNLQDSLDEILDELSKIKDAKPVLGPFIYNFTENASKAGDAYTAVATFLGLLSRNKILNPNTLFDATYCIWNWFPRSNFRSVIGNVVSSYFTNQWMHVIENQQFLLYQPSRTIPVIKEVLENDSYGEKKIAEIILATDSAVQYRLRKEMKASLLESISNHI